MLEGYKTYIVAAVGAIATGLNLLGWLPDSAYQSIMGLVVSGSAFTLRSALKVATDPVGKPE